MQVIVRTKPEDGSIDCLNVQAGIDLGTELGGGCKVLVVDDVVGPAGSQIDMFRCANPLLYTVLLYCSCVAFV